jgi:threonine aldolase
MFDDGAWLRHAAHANAMARLLHDELVGLPSVQIRFPVETNAVFIEMPESVLAQLRGAGWSVPSVFGKTSCRLMCAWDTTAADVRHFAGDVRRLLGPDAGPSS